MDAPSTVLRPALPSDSESAYAVKKAAFGPYIAQVFGWDEERQREFHAEEFDPATIQMVELGGETIGWLGVRPEERALVITGIYLLPAFQGRGIGGELLRGLLAHADAIGAVVLLDVLKINPAYRLYERSGFRVVGENERFYHMERRPHGA